MLGMMTATSQHYCLSRLGKSTILSAHLPFCITAHFLTVWFVYPPRFPTLCFFSQIVILSAWLGAHVLIFTVASQTLFSACFYKKAFSSHFYCPSDRYNPFSFTVALLGASFYWCWNYCPLSPRNQNFVSLVYMNSWREPFAILTGRLHQIYKDQKDTPCLWMSELSTRTESL